MSNRPIIVSPRTRAANWQQDAETRLFKRRMSYQAFAAAATTGDLDITGFPGGVEILGCWISLVTPFTGGGVGTATLSVGSTGTPDLYLTAASVFATAGRILVGVTLLPGTFVGGAATPLAAGTIRVRLTVDTLTNALTAGQADLFVRFQGASVTSS